MEDGGVVDNLDDLDGKGGGLDEHDATEGVREANVRVIELELEEVVAFLEDIDGGLAGDEGEDIIAGVGHLIW